MYRIMLYNIMLWKFDKIKIYIVFDRDFHLPVILKIYIKFYKHLENEDTLYWIKQGLRITP